MSRPDQLRSDAPIWRRLLDLGTELGADWAPVQSGGAQSDAPAEPTALGEATIIEDDGQLEIHEVERGGESGFSYFLDGVEHTRVCGYVGVVPIVHGYVAAVIRQRRARAFSTWALLEEEVLAFPHDLLAPERLTELGFPPGALLDVRIDSAGPHPIRLAEDARGRVKSHRANLERRLARRWSKELPGGGWLLVDGSLAIDPGLLGSGRAVGLVKSHRTQFLEPGAMATVLGMGGARRSSLFKPLRPEVGGVYSWYLRLRGRSGHDIYWGLARIEGRAHDETVDAADELSAWLLAETAPLALPDPRWHVMLYPIRDCEGFLRARMPTLELS